MRCTLRSILGPLLACLLALPLAGCGSDTAGGDTAGDPTSPAGSSSPSGSASTYPPGTKVPFDVVALVSESNTRGPKASWTPVALADDGSLESYAATFQGGMEQKLVAAGEEAEVGPDEVLTATVIDVSCESPSDVRVVRTGDGLEVRTTPVLSRRQCLVPITTVALVVVPSAAL